MFKNNPRPSDFTKPATRKWLQIPNPRTKNEDVFVYMSVGLTVIRSSPLRYKITRLCQQPPNNRLQMPGLRL